MHLFRWTPGLGLAAAIIGAQPAHADDPRFAPATAAEREELAKIPADQVEWKASAQGGLLITSGNSRITALSAGMNASRKAGANKLQLEGSVAYGRSSIFIAADANGNGAVDENEVDRPTTTTNKGWTSKSRYDRFLTADDSLYGAALAAADEPAGKQFVGGGQLGYSRQVFKDAIHTLVAETGYDFSYENSVAKGAAAKIHSGRLFAGYSGKLSDDTGLDGSVETLLNVNQYDDPTGAIDAFEDTRVTSKLSMTTKMFDDVSFRFAFESRFDNAPSARPPFAGLPYAPDFVPRADALDTKVEATLIVNFL